MHILIADDDKIVRKLLRHILKAESSYSLVEAADGQECWDLLESGYRPDVCLLDIDMPRLNGLQLLERMRGSDTYRNIPVLMVTSRTDLNSKASAAAFKSHAFVIKPFQPQKVMALIEEAAASAVREFAPEGFLDRSEILAREKMEPSVYFEGMVNFVELIGFRLDAVEKHLTDEMPDGLIAALQPMRKLGDRLGAIGFLDIFAKLEAALDDESNGALAARRRYFRLLRSEYNDLKDTLETYLNVVISSESASRILTQPDLTDWSGESIQLLAEIEESAVDEEGGFSLGNQRIVLRAFRGERNLMTARLAVEDGRLVLKSSLGAGQSRDAEDFDLTIFPELDREEAVRFEEN